MYTVSMPDILGFNQSDEDDEDVEVLIACDCGAIAVFRRVYVDPPEGEEARPCHNTSKWQHRVVHGKGKDT